MAMTRKPPTNNQPIVMMTKMTTMMQKMIMMTTMMMPKPRERRRSKWRIKIEAESSPESFLLSIWYWPPWPPWSWWWWWWLLWLADLMLKKRRMNKSKMFEFFLFLRETEDVGTALRHLGSLRAVIILMAQKISSPHSFHKTSRIFERKHWKRLEITI